MGKVCGGREITGAKEAHHCEVNEEVSAKMVVDLTERNEVYMWRRAKWMLDKWKC